PTNHLDIASCEALEDALSGYDGTLFIVSHDRYFINRMATRVLYLDRSGCRSYIGSYDDYINEFRRQEQQYVAPARAGKPAS
ncbi:MAG TPA: ABC transporter ATP-binding protein, partial [Ruminococcaceae bacterium]|nr:ABC transporter ATP-binding protein [Oscillospiraceae bacterium]